MSKTVLAIDAAWGGIGWAIYDGRRVLRTGWKTLPADKRTLRALRDWLDESLLPHCGSVDAVFVENTNVFGAPEDSDGKPQNFMLAYQVSVRECAQAVSMWCVMMDVGQGEPTMVFPATWRSSYKAIIPKPRPKGAAEWKQWSQKIASQMFPGCLDGYGKKSKEDVSDACLLAAHGYGTLQPSVKILKERRK